MLTLWVLQNRPALASAFPQFGIKALHPWPQEQGSSSGGVPAEPAVFQETSPFIANALAVSFLLSFRGGCGTLASLAAIINRRSITSYDIKTGSRSDWSRLKTVASVNVDCCRETNKRAISQPA